MSKIVVGLSGGVDSSVAAAVLHNQGHDVIGLTLWLMKGKGQCCSEGMVDAAQLCADLGLRYEVVDSRELFEQNIVDYLVAGYSQGVTPLPCSQCNRTVKFGPMLDYARTHLDTDQIATGHYARITRADTGRYELRRAVDRQKDQSYFLYDLTQEQLAASRFPLGEQTKAETRRVAAELGLHTAEKPESQDLCLVEQHGSMQKFLDRYLAPKPGDIVDTSGVVLGQHRGIHHYTIGQRKGLGIAAPQPLYVVALDAARNRVVVGERTSGQQSECGVQRVNWVSIAPPQSPVRVQVQIRYRSAAIAATVIPLSVADALAPSARLIFDEPQFGLTPGQAAVWYDETDRLLGGGLIEPFQTAAAGLAEASLVPAPQTVPQNPKAPEP
ncbi:tRNA 2-thiouridine(34) synthase MnmA [Romeria aff. gracilis LEGE 07310]|uniref:tRNA-specific 2-thiouridylase MnmA n=1 Tax=Vasconcelosia minhoensis LEGE 07310 TaxID=915328 RepID=A0A8J7AJR0_9CYAN|nr:tRNA 2-thiouridine(34) synthase MnmA [Romeria gracilis]MBE9078868.1 tRNA 2-thiouridine(34) synthase MnmA [Romeria aff. gracilis LEGE 07310]